MKRKYNADAHGTFEEEWKLHRNAREWYYSTSILEDSEGRMYSCQYTLMSVAFGPFAPKVAMAALTDFTEKKHHYLQVTAGAKTKVAITDTKAAMGDFACAEKTADGMHITLKQKDFSIDLMAGWGKGAVWHCDGGKLQMGIPDKKQTTVYYSWTNMPTTAVLVLDGKEIQLTGKTWFDRQGGSYDITKMATQWEWFSLRFFDDEEVMLFCFPQNTPQYYDGTYIKKDGTYERLNDYTIERTSVTEFRGLKWSDGWNLHMRIKDRDYTITPVQEGHMNFAYFEELCYIKDSSGKTAGYAFAELLPGVLNNGFKSGSTDSGEKIAMGDLFKRIEF